MANFALTPTPRIKENVFPFEPQMKVFLANGNYFFLDVEPTTKVQEVISRIFYEIRFNSEVEKLVRESCTPKVQKTLKSILPSFLHLLNLGPYRALSPEWTLREASRMDPQIKFRLNLDILDLFNTLNCPLLKNHLCSGDPAKMEAVENFHRDFTKADLIIAALATKTKISENADELLAIKGSLDSAMKSLIKTAKKWIEKWIEENVAPDKRRFESINLSQLTHTVQFFSRSLLNYSSILREATKLATSITESSRIPEGPVDVALSYLDRDWAIIKKPRHSDAARPAAPMPVTS